MMKKRAFTFWEAAFTIALLAIAAAILFPFFGRKRENGTRWSCQSNLKLIGIGFKQYVQDYDEKYPLVNAGKQGWADGVMPYVRNTRSYQCPQDASGNVVNRIDYFYNARLSGLADKKVRFPANTLITGDGIPDSAGNASLTNLPKSWVTNQQSPAWRHLENGAAYGYADGHAKWIKPENISDAKATSSESTFAPW